MPLKPFIRKLLIGVSRGPGSWLTLVLLLVVLVPSACLLWFMNQAVQNEQLAVRQKLFDAYRGHLALAQQRLAAQWTNAASDLADQARTTPAPQLFSRAVRADLVDALVIYDAAANVVYPDRAVISDSLAPTPKWAEAQALESGDPGAAAIAYAAIAAQTDDDARSALAMQAQARCLLQSGDKAAALAILTGPLMDERYRDAVDAHGRLLAPASDLLALELLAESDPARSHDLRQRLRSRLDDYEGTVMPGTQRRFLMHQLCTLFPDEADLPTLSAEELAADYLDAAPTGPREPVFRVSPLPGVWQFSSPDGRIVMLHRTESLKARVRSLLARDLSPDMVVNLAGPGEEIQGAFDSIPAGPMLPGWNLVLALTAPELFKSLTDQRTRTYVWIGVLCVAIVTVLTALALGMVRRQMALTQLRNDLVANVTHELKTPLSSMRLLVETLLNAPLADERTTREYLQLIAKENLRLSRLIDNFLTFSRIEKDKYTFDFKETPAGAILAEAAATVRERFNVPGCHFQVQNPPNLPAVMADADAMVTALVNLLDNAYKYSGDDKEILLTAAVENGSVAFAVKDNGIGLSPRETGRIFKRFYRADQHRSLAGGGAGIGLSIVEFVVSAHRGNVQVQSAPGSGSTFIIRIPAARSHP